MDIWRFSVDNERLDDLQKVEGDGEHIHTQVVDVYVEAITLIWTEAICRCVV